MNARELGTRTRPRLLPADRWVVAKGYIGEGTTITIHRVNDRSVIHRPSVEVYVGGVIHRLPIDGRWGTGIVPFGSEA